MTAWCLRHRSRFLMVLARHPARHRQPAPVWSWHEFAQDWAQCLGILGRGHVSPRLDGTVTCRLPAGSDATPSQGVDPNLQRGCPLPTVHTIEWPQRVARRHSSCRPARANESGRELRGSVVPLPSGCRRCHFVPRSGIAFSSGLIAGRAATSAAIPKSVIRVSRLGGEVTTLGMLLWRPAQVKSNGLLRVVAVLRLRRSATKSARSRCSLTIAERSLDQ
jgi:hypothetical protein